MVTRLVTSIFLVAATLLSPAQAQHQQGHHGGMGSHPTSASPYAGLEARPIKALSDQQIADLRAGRGMSLAVAAELNGYPGPLHVLELADQLGLSHEQRDRVEALYAPMKRETVRLGEQLIQQEADLDRLFASRTVTPATLSAAMSAIGATQAALREAHLRHHLSTAEILSPDQVERYSRARGYYHEPAAR